MNMMEVRKNILQSLMGGFAYSGPNAAHTQHLEKGIKWQKFLTDPENLRVEDATMPLQDYPYVPSSSRG
jgi:hypothetical protein